MPMGFSFALFCLTITGFVAVGVTTYLLGASRPEIRFTASVAALLIATVVAFTPLLLLAVNPEARAALQEKARASGQKETKETPARVVQQWIALYGKDTPRAAKLTTTRFREGKNPTEWATSVQRLLNDIGYQHLGGEIIEETISSSQQATVTLKARIVAIDGPSTQTEVYQLRRIDAHWLIDDLAVRDEILESHPQ